MTSFTQAFQTAVHEIHAMILCLPDPLLNIFLSGESMKNSISPGINDYYDKDWNGRTTTLPNM